MKKKIVQLISSLALNDTFWRVAKPFSSLGRAMYKTREDDIRRRATHKAVSPPTIFKQLTVLNGPFAGMKYPKMLSKGSTLYPKLLGSYERELHTTILEFQKNAYSEILDIGCAEGYYAVGIARTFSFDRLYAYDLDSSAQDACRDMATKNKIEHKIEIRAGLDSNSLGNFTFSGRGLIICDCEGYEEELFDQKNLQNLRNCDLIIETHDLFDIGISTRLSSLFSATHHIETIYSTDDIIKALDWEYDELQGMSFADKKTMLEEKRPAIMKWLVCRPKTFT